MSGSSYDSSALMEKPEELTPVKKRKLTNSKKSRNDTQNTLSLNEVINLGIPHVGELIFESFDTPGLINCLEVSQTWRELAENVLTQRWKGRMFEACKNGLTQIVQLLLECFNCEENGLNIKDENGFTAFMVACNDGHKDVVKLLLDQSERIDLNARDFNGMTAFMWACQNGHRNVAKLLLDHFDPNIDLNATSRSGLTAFMLACSYGHTNVVQLLLYNSERIELNARSSNNSKKTAFICACENGHKNIVKMIVEHSEGIDLNAKADDTGRTAFMAACRYGHKDVVKLLLNYPNRIELNAKDDEERTAFMIAIMNGTKCKYVVWLLDKYEDIIDLTLPLKRKKKLHRR